MTNFETYLSPYTWRYGTPAMRKIWSETHKRCLWRQIWVALAEAQSHFGLVTEEQVADLRAHAEDIDVAQALEIEAQIHHDLMAEIKVYAAQCSRAGGIIHLGATSMDIKDNALVLQQRSALALLTEQIRELLVLFTEHILNWADTSLMGFTHLQPAEPTTLGYRLAQPAQDLLSCYQDLKRAESEIKSKGFTEPLITTWKYLYYMNSGTRK